MFFNPRLILEEGEDKICITANTAVVIPDFYASKFITNTINKYRTEAAENETECLKITFNLGIPDLLISRVKLYREYSENDEEYFISFGETIDICARTEAGLIFALATIEQLICENEMASGLIYDYPVCPIRGYRVYLPGRENIKTFKEMIDFLVYYKFNNIILEIGGAMEYKNHPEINEAWVEFCTDMREYSGKAHVIQNKTYGWEKNSIHCDNGDGNFLTQDECRDIKTYCNERGIKVIPEVPCLSHSDYLLLRRPDLREQVLDNHADTYCPSNPESYKLLFEVMDEVIDVFKPEYINIGHDEAYTVGVCERCKGKDPAELYAGDIVKIHDYLTSKGIKTMMWGEKLINAHFDNGTPCGGAESSYIDEKTGEKRIYIPALYRCAGMLPKDILILHWYWSFDYNYDRVYHDNGYQMVFGNLNADQLKNWKLRLEWGAKGGFVSNWGSCSQEYMQRNMQTFALIYTSYSFWCEDYDDEELDYFMNHALQEAYRQRHLGWKDTITVVHTTDYNIPYKVFYDGIFIENDLYALGNYVIEYTDGTSSSLEVKYGTNITNCDLEMSPKCYAFVEINSATLPIKIGDKMYYECMYKNPCPDKTPISFKFIPVEGKNVTIYLRSVSYNN